MLVSIYSVLSLASVPFSKQPQTVFAFTQFEAVSNKNTLELSNEVLLNETNQNHVNTKATRVYSFVKKINI